MSSTPVYRPLGEEGAVPPPIQLNKQRILFASAAIICVFVIIMVSVAVLIQKNKGDEPQQYIECTANSSVCAAPHLYCNRTKFGESTTGSSTATSADGSSTTTTSTAATSADGSSTTASGTTSSSTASSSTSAASSSSTAKTNRKITLRNSPDSDPADGTSESSTAASTTESSTAASTAESATASTAESSTAASTSPESSTAASIEHFFCDCESGFDLTKNGSACEDINECARKTDNCDPNADCKNLPGNFSCSCKQGFEGDGIHCQDVNECDNTTAYNCSTHSHCQNTIGSYECICDDGYWNKTINNASFCQACISEITCNGFGTCNNATGDCECDATHNYTVWDECNACIAANYEKTDTIQTVLALNNTNGNTTCYDVCFEAQNRSTNGTVPCSACSADHYGYPDCVYCTSATNCSEHGYCDTTGDCICNSTHNGSPNCSSCSTDYYNYPTCTFCNTTTCNEHGTCNETAQCKCTEGYAGEFCEKCDGTGTYPHCASCTEAKCNGFGHCDSDTGECICNATYSGAFCDKCDTNYFNYPDCTYCSKITTCNAHGACNETTGACECDSTYDSLNSTNITSQCDTCSADHYNYPTCAYCDAAITCSGHGECDNTTGQCVCTPAFNGSSCEICATDYYSSSATSECDTLCNRTDTCNGHGKCNNTGLCECDPGYNETYCNSCGPDHYAYPDCIECNSTACNVTGTCNHTTGICDCVENYEGDTCDRCISGRYGPKCDMDCDEPCEHGQCGEEGTGCTCDEGYAGDACNMCKQHYYKYPECIYCLDSATCNGHGVCNTAGPGLCDCDAAYQGDATCGQCTAGYYGFPACTSCYESTTCNGHGECNDKYNNAGEPLCKCETGFAGPACSSCDVDFKNYPTCTYCSNSVTCNGNGACLDDATCVCKSNFSGPACADCAQGWHTYPACDIFCADATTCNGNGVCNSSTGECECKEGFETPNCGKCSQDYFDYPNCIYCKKTETCNEHADCNNLGQCVCNAGFTGTGSVCADINECEDKTKCQEKPNSNCENTIGGYNCKCKSGYDEDKNNLCVNEDSEYVGDDDKIDQNEGDQMRGVYALFGLGGLVLLLVGVIYWRKRSAGRQAAAKFVKMQGILN